MTLTRRSSRILVASVPFVIVAAAWWLSVAVFNPNPATLAGPAAVWDSFMAALGDGSLARHIVASLQRMGLGISVGAATGAAVGLLAGRVPRIAAIVNPLSTFFVGMAGITWVPLAIVWFGLGTGMVVFIIWNTVFFIVMMTTMLGVSQVPRIWEEVALTMGGSAVQRFVGVVIPGALPQAIGGLRTAIGFAFRAVVAAEIIGASSGLGFMIFTAGMSSRSQIVMMGNLVVALLALLTDRVVLAPIERRTVLRWGTVGAAGEGAKA